MFCCNIIVQSIRPRSLPTIVFAVTCILQHHRLPALLTPPALRGVAAASVYDLIAVISLFFFLVFFCSIFLKRSWPIGLKFGNNTSIGPDGDNREIHREMFCCNIIDESIRPRWLPTIVFAATCILQHHRLPALLTPPALRGVAAASVYDLIAVISLFFSLSFSARFSSNVLGLLVWNLATIRRLVRMEIIEKFIVKCFDDESIRPRCLPTIVFAAKCILQHHRRPALLTPPASRSVTAASSKRIWFTRRYFRIFFLVFSARLSSNVPTYRSEILLQCVDWSGRI